MSSFRRSISGLVLLLCATIPASAFPVRGGSSNVAPVYSDLCSQANVTCAYAYSVTHRLVSTNTIPFVITRISDSATHNAVYTGSSFYIDVAAEESFCLGNGGTTTSGGSSPNAYVTYTDCKITTLYDQVGSGCDLTPPQANKNFPYRIWVADGYPVLLSPGAATNGSSGTTVPWLSNSGAVCGNVSGTVAKTLIDYTNSQLPSGCCGEIGLMETGSGNPPSYPITAVVGSMFSQSWYNGDAVPSPGTQANFGSDWEGGGNPNTYSLLTPTGLSSVWGVGIISWSGVGTNKTNIWFNNVQGATNETPSKTLNTQNRMTIGCDGDLLSCAPITARDLVFTSNDVSATGGLPALIYTYLTNLYMGL